jgi:hypothetical protein
MNHPEHSPKATSSRTGVFVALRALLGFQGTGAPSCPPTANPVSQSTAAGKLTNRVKLPARRVAIIVAAFVSLALVPAAAHAEPCPNEKLREEQPYALQLPDCRAYELVSPTNTNGQDATGFDAESAARASEAPEGTQPAITYSAQGSYRNAEGALLENQYLSRRTPTGWTTQNTTPLFTTDKGQEANSTYPTTLFTPELTEGLTITTAQLNEEAPVLSEAYGVYRAQFASKTYQYVSDTGEKEIPWGASTDLERVVLTNSENGSLVEEIAGTEVPVKVSVTNTGEVMAASAGSPAEENNFAKYKDAWHAVSEDGSRVYFTTPPFTSEGVGQVFARVNIGAPQSAVGGGGECLEPAKACTIEVSASKRTPEDPAGPRSARYWGASTNGEKVLFTSDSELTQNAYTGPDDNAANLYEYDLNTDELKDLTVDSADLAEGAAVRGVVQISNDGSYVYFVAEGKLATGATQGEPNLYVTHEDGAPVFIASLAPKDQTDWLNGDAEKAGPELNTAVATPKGSQLAFISERSLPTVNFPSGYDNQQAPAGDCQTELTNHEHESGMCREVYLYNTEIHSLVCASCNPSGARPVGPSSLTGVNPVYQSFASNRPRDLLADGTLFFDSKDALVAGASGGQGYVYEYEGGTVRAISAVAGGFEAFFLDASPNGENVFFASADRLLPEDPGGNTVVWDAREDGGFPAPPPECTTAEACRNASPYTPGVYGPPPSATFSGPGNLVPPPPAAVVKPKPKVVKCKKNFVKNKKGKCVRKKSKKRAKKSSKSKRGGKS